MNRLLKNKQAIFLFMLPVVILFLMIVAAPVFLSGYYSLLEWDGMGKQEFVGLANYVRLLRTRAINFYWLCATV